MSRKYNTSKPEYINELPENVFEYINDRYWVDIKNNRLIMKTKLNKFKIVHPMSDKYHDSRFIHLYIDGNKTYMNYDYLINSHSIGFFLDIDNYDYIIDETKGK